MVMFVVFYSIYKERGYLDIMVFFYLWIVFYIISFCYIFIWDFKMDWGFFDKNVGENIFFWEEIVYF